MKINIFRGDLTDVSAKKEALVVLFLQHKGVVVNVVTTINV